MKQLCFPVQTSLWRPLPLIPFPQLGPDSAPTETSWIFPFVQLWTSWTFCSWKPAMPMGACLPELNLVQSCSCTVHCYSHKIAVPPQLKGISLKNPDLGDFWGGFCSGVANAMRTICAGVLGQPGCLGSGSSTATGTAHRSSLVAQKQDSALRVGLKAHYSPFVNCQQEAVTLVSHLNNPLKNKIQWHCWSIASLSASRPLALAFAFLVHS